MIAELLITHFSRISDSPDAVPRLRKFVLDLAVRGKLVEQEPKEEPASELLKRIQIEKVRLGATGDRRRPPELSRVGASEIPFAIPKNWEWVRLVDLLLKLTDGTHHSPPNFAKGEFKYITAKNIKPEGVSLEDVTYVSKDVHQEIYARCNPEKGDILYIKDGATTGVVTVNNLDEPFSLLSSVALLKSSRVVSNRLLVEFLRSPFFYLQMRGFMKGAAITRVTLKRMAPALVPLPPTNEQHRIVVKIDELMALCDRLETAQRERETRRNRLTLASNYHLNNAVGADTYLQYGRFYLGNLPALTCQPDQIVRVRQTILRLALRGQLVAQDPNDEPASVLLSRIAQGRAKLLDQAYPNPSEARTQSLKQQKQLLPEDIGPLPRGWQWATLMQCSALVVDCHNKTAPYSNSGVILLRTTNIRDGRLNLNEPKFVDEQTYTRWSARCQPEPGDILITREAPMGEVCIVPQGMRICLGQRMMLTRLVPNTLDPRFLLYSLRDPSLMDRVQDKPVGATVQHLRVGGVETLLVAVPPIEEQYRIVAKVDELMAICERLATQLSTLQHKSSRLLEFVLDKAVSDRCPEPVRELAFRA